MAQEEKFDLKKEIQQHINDCLNIKFPTTDIKLIAKDVEYTAHKFFELGLKEQKEQMMKNSFNATVCKVGATFLKEMDKDYIVKALESYSDGDKVKVIIISQE